MARLYRRPLRRGSLLPLLAVSVISLFAFVALAVDLGMLAVSRTQCQNSADASALTGCRTLNNNPGVMNSNLTQAVANAKTTATSNYFLSTNFTSSQIQKIEVGQYLYNTSTQTFGVSTWTDVTTSQSATPSSGSWTAIRVTMSVSQPTYFMSAFGVTTMPMSAVATAVFKPRDVAFVLDMTGSMKFASNFNYNGVSLNPDTNVPVAGHYLLVQSNLVATSNQTDSSNEAISRNNYTITTPGGPPIVQNFYYDKTNYTTPATAAYPLSSTSNLLNAFQNWNPPQLTAGDPTNYIGATFDYTGYNAFSDPTGANPTGPLPAPDTFASMTDSAKATYVGDRWRRADGSLNKTDTTWATSAASTRGAATAIELLGYNISGSNVRGGTSGSTTITTVDKFRDPVWEKYGYDLDLVKYRSWKGNNAPTEAAPYETAQGGAANVTVAAADQFLGYSMGPTYWGKTFYIWPPDPRFSTSANLTSPNPSRPGFDTSGNPMCDWRRHFFFNSSGSAWTVNSGSSTSDMDNSLFNSGSGMTLNSGGFTVNYAAVLKWIKSGPQVLPPNLRAGRVLYYSSIPDDVNTATGTAQQKLDKVFWQNYIDYVLGNNWTSGANLYGVADNPGGTFGLSIYSNNLNPWKGPSNSFTTSGSITPYMAYNDSPLRPRLHFWFGPLSMVNFIGNGYANQFGGYVNWDPGTCNEAQCWQLKAGMNSVIGDVQSNHPNDYVGMTMFAYDTNAPPTIYQHPRVPIGQNYTALKNALFYPQSLLSVINAGDTTTEYRPYDSSFNNLANPDQIPNANGGTDPNTGLAIAFNILSPSSQLPAEYGTIKGRRGASKLVIFETDGVPNCHSTYTLNQKGYDTYYSNFNNGGYDGNGGSGAMTPAINVAKQITTQMASNNTSGTNSGLSLPNAPARIYPIAFGDLFDPVAAPNATFRSTALQFLANIAAAGNTATASNGTTIPSNQIITGPYATRIQNLKSCLQTIFQSGVAVVLVQ